MCHWVQAYNGHLAERESAPRHTHCLGTPSREQATLGPGSLDDCMLCGGLVYKTLAAACPLLTTRNTRATARVSGHSTGASRALCWGRSVPGFAAEAHSAKWKPERRQRLRARYSARILAAVERMMIEHLPIVMPSSLLGQAMQYMSGQWPKLVRYVENGNWPISNNACHAASGMTPVKTRSGRSSLHARASCFPIRLPTHMPARIYTRWSSRQKPTV